MSTKQQQSDPVRVIAVSSGKGGVGKTNISINLSIALSQYGKDVMLLDADLGLANVDVLLGLHPLRNLSHVVDYHVGCIGQCDVYLVGGDLWVCQ